MSDDTRDIVNEAVVERECESCHGHGVIRESAAETRQCLDCTGTGTVAVRIPLPRDVAVDEISPGDKEIWLVAKDDPHQNFRVTVSRDDCDTAVAEAVARKLAAAYNEIDALRGRLAEAEIAMQAAQGALGMHGPCRNNNCLECGKAFDKLRAALRATKGTP